jgi:hypothetical protein
MAEQDLGNTLEDSVNGFGISATLIDTTGNSAVLNIQSGDVHLLFDTGGDVRVNSRTAHASVRIASLIAAGLEMPKAQPDQSKNPYIFEFADANGASRKFIASQPSPDRTLGIVTVILELMTE